MSLERAALLLTIVSSALASLILIGPVIRGMDELEEERRRAYQRGYADGWNDSEDRHYYECEFVLVERNPSVRACLLDVWRREAEARDAEEDRVRREHGFQEQ